MDPTTGSESTPSTITFTSYSDKDCTESLKSIAAFVNPETFQVSIGVTYKEEKKLKPETNILTNVSQKQSISFQNLIVDGTGIIPLAADYKSTGVQGYLNDLREVVLKYDGSSHENVYITIKWGSVLNFKGVCTSMKIKYTLFSRSGAALRASVDMDFQQTASLAVQTAETQPTSPDLTHARTVQAGDTLPLMTYRIYGDSSYYLEVAKINKLDTINAIRPGDVIFFPPLKK